MRAEPRAWALAMGAPKSSIHLDLMTGLLALGLVEEVFSHRLGVAQDRVPWRVNSRRWKTSEWRGPPQPPPLKAIFGSPCPQARPESPPETVGVSVSWLEVLGRLCELTEHLFHLVSLLIENKL